jgi:hypothetical protein
MSDGPNPVADRLHRRGDGIVGFSPSPNSNGIRIWWRERNQNRSDGRKRPSGHRSRSVGPRPRRSRLAVRPHRGAARSHPNHRHVSRGRLVFARLVDPGQTERPLTPSTGLGTFGRLRATEDGIRCDSQRYVARYCRRYLARCGSARCRWMDPWTHHHGVSGGDRGTERVQLGGAGRDDAGVVCAT